jgi:hypothetical protein
LYELITPSHVIHDAPVAVAIARAHRHPAS